MIHISGQVDPQSDEYQAAIRLRQLIIFAWPGLEGSTQDHIHIVVGVKCHGQIVRDVDLLVLGALKSDISFKPYLPFTGRDGEIELPENVVVQSFCLAIEVKEHSPSNIRFRGTNVDVYYRKSQLWHSASQQNEEQKQSIINYLKLQGFNKVPWVTPLIWLRNVPSSDLPPRPHDILGSEADWELLINVVNQLHAPENLQGKWVLNAGLESREVIENIALALTKQINPTEIDRQRMEQINQRLSSELGLSTSVGKKLLILRGRGGTGKTISLLQLAKHLYDERAARILVLTYNRALVADLRRLMVIMGIGDGYAEQSIQIQTVHSFLYHAMKTWGIFSKGEEEFLEKYSEFKRETLELLSSGTITYDDIQSLIQADANRFAWDFVFVDEGQDWPNDEREILFRLFAYNFFAVADGIDQLIREERPANWRGMLLSEQFKIVPLKRCLRMKSGLTTCISSFAARLGLQQSEWESNELVPGGRIVVFENDNLETAEKLILEVVHDAEEAGNERVDLLFCVPSTMTHSGTKANGLYSVPALFERWGLTIWDGTTSSGRELYPTDNDQLRIVQYESCRGLEGWSVVLFGLDEFYSLKLNRIRAAGASESQAKLQAARWLMIPLTRAMDTMVIHLSSRASLVKDVLKDIASQHGDIVEWRQY